MMSAGEEHIKGPMARPKAGIATVQLICWREAEYWVWRAGKEGTVVVVIYVKRKYLVGIQLVKGRVQGTGFWGEIERTTT